VKAVEVGLLQEVVGVDFTRHNCLGELVRCLHLLEHEAGSDDLQEGVSILWSELHCKVEVLEGHLNVKVWIGDVIRQA